MKWTKAENIVCEELDGGALLVNAASGNRWSLNATAAALWRLCEGRLTSVEIAEALNRRVEEIALFCDQFRAQGLLVPALSTPSSVGAQMPVALHYSAPAFKALGLGSGPRRRPTPRGVSGPG